MLLRDRGVRRPAGRKDLELLAEIVAKGRKALLVLVQPRRLVVRGAQHHFIANEFEQPFAVFRDGGMALDERFHKQPLAALPTIALLVQQAFDQRGVVTCGGRFDGHGAIPPSAANAR